MTDHDNISAGPNDRPHVDPHLYYAISNIRAAQIRSFLLTVMRLVQDLLYRVAILILLFSRLPMGRHGIGVIIIVLFCVLLYVSREKMNDTIQQIDSRFVVGAENLFFSDQRYTWQYFEALLGARSTSRPDLIIVDTVLRFEPLIWAVAGVVTVLSKW